MKYGLVSTKSYSILSSWYQEKRMPLIILHGATIPSVVVLSTKYWIKLEDWYTNLILLSISGLLS